MSDPALTDEVIKLKKQNATLAKRKRKVENDFRKMHQAMVKMSEFMDVKDVLINQSIRAVIRFGWDSVKWANGYTALHFAAECTDAPDVVELLAMLATDFNCRDTDGYRPLDYARNEPRKENVRVLEKMRERMVRDRRAQDALSLKHGLALELPDDMMPALQAGMEGVLHLGWKNIMWPRGYTALHVAAEHGHLAATKMLLEEFEGVAADINRVDDQEKRAIDYAIKHNHDEVVRYLENFDPSAPRQPPGESTQDTDSMGEMLPSVGVWPKSADASCYTTASESYPLQVPPEVSTTMRKACLEVLNGNKVFPPGSLPLHTAAKVGDTSAAYLLLQHGIATDTKDTHGKTAKDYARESNNTPLLAVLEEADKESLEHTSASTAVQRRLERELAQARAQLQKLIDERRARLSEMESVDKTESRQLRARVQHLTAQLETGKSGALIGPLTPEQVAYSMEKLNTFGAEAFRDKLLEDHLSGGLGLSLEEAALALEQMLYVQASNGPDPPIRAPCLRCKEARAEALAPPAKGKGPPLPQGKGPATSSTDSGKGKAPPVPVGKGLPSRTDPAPGKGKAPAVPAGKGLPPSKGPVPGKGKGPPLPAGKGKGVPAGKGKGPLPPGKGPPLPAGKGPPILAGKGPAGKGTKGPGKTGKPGGGIKAASTMKPLWWSKLSIAQLKSTATIWHDCAKLYDETFALLQEQLHDEFVLRFSKNSAASQSKARTTVDVQAKNEKEPESMRVITDPQLIVGREAAVKMLPDPNTVAKAVMDLDDAILSPNLLEIVKHNCCPTPPQLHQLQEMRKEHPVTPWALPEKYLWHIGTIPAYQQRVDCWLFVRSYEEQATQYNIALDNFMSAVKCMRKSVCLPMLLSLIIACGNGLNAGTNRGNAEGFDLDALTKLDTVKDNDGKKNLVSFVLEVFFGKLDTNGFFQEPALIFTQDLGPLLLNVRRRIQKSSDGSEKLEKCVMYTIEDFDVLIRTLSEECDQRYDSLQMCLQFVEDPVDPIRTVLAEEFLEAKEKLKKLNAKKEKCRTAFSDLQSYFTYSSTSTDFMMLWDNLLIPGDLVVNKPDAVKKKYMMPMFCSGKELDMDAMEVLWEMKRPGEKRRNSRRSRRSVKPRHSRTSKSSRVSQRKN